MPPVCKGSVGELLVELFSCESSARNLRPVAHAGPDHCGAPWTFIDAEARVVAVDIRPRPHALGDAISIDLNIRTEPLTDPGFPDAVNHPMARAVGRPGPMAGNATLPQMDAERAGSC